MKKIESVEEIFAKENLDANAITVNGIPERHVEAVIALAKLFTVIDHHNPNFQPDFEDFSQSKYSPYFTQSSSSGGRFSFVARGDWHTVSNVGSRLVSESGNISKMIAENYPELYNGFMVYKRELKK